MASVFVRGFDFGTTEQLIKNHCSKAGIVKTVEMWGNGAAVVTYASQQMAAKAVGTLNQTTIPGNSRYIDVKINDESKGGKRGPDGAGRVFVRGFDFGTTDEMLEGHMAQAGTMVKVQWCTKGSAIVHYSTKEEAEYAVSSLNQTTIEGNSRFIDVILKEDDDFAPPAKRFKGGGKGAAAGGHWAWIPGPSSYGGKGKSAGKGSFGKGKSDPPGSGRVFARGFDFGTTDEQLMSHCGSVGNISKVFWCNKGSAIIVYETKAQAQAAVNQLNGTTIPGNSRFMDVLLKESE